MDTHHRLCVLQMSASGRGLRAAVASRRSARAQYGNPRSAFVVSVELTTCGVDRNDRTLTLRTSTFSASRRANKGTPVESSACLGDRSERAACDDVLGAGGARPRALDLDENGIGRALWDGSRRTAMLGFTFRGSRVSEFLRAEKRLYSATARRSFSVVRAQALALENAEC